MCYPQNNAIRVARNPKARITTYDNLKYVTLVQGVYRLRKPLAYSFKK